MLYFIEVDINRYGECDKSINELTIPKTYVMVFGTFTQRGYNGVPTTWKARIAFTRWSGLLQRSAKRRGCLLSYSQAEPGRELTQPSLRLLAEPCKIISLF